jgi:hypothetical protein
MEKEIRKYMDRLSEVKAVIETAHDALVETHDPKKDDSALTTLSVGLRLWRELDGKFCDQIVTGDKNMLTA